jgi:hypothetical protein
MKRFTVATAPCTRFAVALSCPILTKIIAMVRAAVASEGIIGTIVAAPKASARFLPLDVHPGSGPRRAATALQAEGFAIDKFAIAKRNPSMSPDSMGSVVPCTFLTSKSAAFQRFGAQAQAFS